MKRVCAWCERVMDSPDGDSDQITHGKCPACFDSKIAKQVCESRGTKEWDGNAIEIKR